MDGIAWLLLISVVVGFVAGYRYGAGVGVTGLFSGHSLRVRQPEKASTFADGDKQKDPVCGEMISVQRAKPSVYKHAVYYLCSRECREIFEAAPHLYVDTMAQEARADLPDGRRF